MSRIKISLDVADGALQLDSQRAFHYLWLNWRLIGMHPTRRYRTLYFIYSALCNIIFAVLLPVTMVANLFFITELEQVFGNLYLSITMTMATMKQFAIWSHRRQMLRVNYYLKRLDARCSPHWEERQHVLAAIRISHLFYMAYMFLYEMTTTGFAYIGITNRQLVYDAWIPPIYADPEKNLTLTLIYQNVAVMGFFVLQNVNNDIYPQCYLAMMIGHLRALAARIARIGADRSCSSDDNVRELYNCIEDHKNVLGYFDCIRPVISLSIFMQFGCTAFVLCLTAVKLATMERDAAQLLFAGTYIIALLMEPLPCCWFINALMEESRQLTLAMYSCRWYEQNLRFRKTLIIFMQQSQKTNTIVAADLVPATLQTFVSIIRFSFSMYTILNG